MLTDTKTCSDPSGCIRTDMAGRGLCNRHYQIHKLHGDLEEIAPRVIDIVCIGTCGGIVFQSSRYNAKYHSPSCRTATLHKQSLQNKYQGARRRETCKLASCSASLKEKRPHALFCSTAHEVEFKNLEVSARRKAELAGRVCACGCGRSLEGRIASTKFATSRCKSLFRRVQKHGLETAEQLQAFLEANPDCGVCSTTDWGPKGSQIDHDHACCDGDVFCGDCIRGLLCGNCNQGLGRFDDDPTRLLAAIVYLHKYHPYRFADLPNVLRATADFMEKPL